MTQADFVYIVSGLPRAGTSLLMQMVASGGLEVLTDGARPADDNNPRGYFEDERVKDLADDSSWLWSAQGKAVKIVVPLLPFLPEGLKCKIAIIQRDLAEVVASQHQMLLRLGQPTSANPGLMASFFETQYQHIISSLLGRPEIAILEVQHARVVAGDRHEISRIMEFFDLPAEKLDLMTACVDPRLYRSHRSRDPR